MGKGGVRAVCGAVGDISILCGGKFAGGFCGGAGTGESGGADDDGDKENALYWREQLPDSL